MLFFLSCIMSKTDLSAQITPKGEYSAGIRQHALLLELFGPSVTAEFAPDRHRLALGGEVALGAIWESFCGGEDICDLLAPSFRYSVLGLQAVEYQHKESSDYIGILSPYLQAHVPFGCKGFHINPNLNAQDPDPCFSVFGSVEYQNLLQAPNQVFFGIGISYARLIH